jgi:hypothetical protein
MHIGEGKLVEVYLNSGGRIDCAPELIPAPGQYLLAHAPASASPVAVPTFFSESTPAGFRFAPPVPSAWMPGARLNLRGPLGRGFSLPASARRVALIAFDDSPSRLRGLIRLALEREAALALVCAHAAEDLPEEVEVQPLRAMDEIIEWADYIAFDAARESLLELRARLEKRRQVIVSREAQILIRAPMPCGALAECGVCAVMIRHEWKMACKDGPVFDLKDLM